MPAVGSSSSSRRGLVASARPISSSFWSPCARFAALTCALGVRSSRSMISSASSAAPGGGKRPSMLQDCRRCDPTAASRHCRKVRLGNSDATWKARPTPRRTISRLDRPTRSMPPNRTWPASGRMWPEIRLKNVVLPAPLGPMTAVSEPSGKSSETSRMATTPPKDFDRRSTFSPPAFSSPALSIAWAEPRHSCAMSPRPASPRRPAA